MLVLLSVHFATQPMAKVDVSKIFCRHPSFKLYMRNVGPIIVFNTLVIVGVLGSAEIHRMGLPKLSSFEWVHLGCVISCMANPSQSRSHVCVRVTGPVCIVNSYIVYL